jgi:hypothetical protein
MMHLLRNGLQKLNVQRVSKLSDNVQVLGKLKEEEEEEEPHLLQKNQMPQLREYLPLHYNHLQKLRVSQLSENQVLGQLKEEEPYFYDVQRVGQLRENQVLG